VQPAADAEPVALQDRALEAISDRVGGTFCPVELTDVYTINILTKAF
jgi:hypothetical protein